MKYKLLLGIFICSCTLLNSQSWRQRMDSINKVSHQEHQLLLQQLGISELRPGPSGNPESPNAANTDELKATTYSSLPDPLLFENGNKVKTAIEWENRREELLELFDREIYGRLPTNVPEVLWKVEKQWDSIIGKFPVTIKELAGRADNSSFPELSVTINMTVIIPSSHTQAVPVIVEFGWNFPGMTRPISSETTSWQEQLLEKGWGYAILIPTSYQADNGAGLREGIIGLTNKGSLRKNDEWGSLRAWAWGASRAMDYFETDEAVDSKKIGIEGLSRYGKAALVAMAYEPRIAIAFVGSSGAGGAKLLRRNFGEQVENLASSGEYHWFTPNFIKYAGPMRPNDLPVDAHELIALCAPRPVFISTGDPSVEGGWVDAKGMFLAAVHAGPVYTLLGKKDLGSIKYPGTGVFLHEGEIAFRQHEGGHTVIPNWPFFIQYAEKYFIEK
jgi:hypothetical protein